MSERPSMWPFGVSIVLISLLFIGGAYAFFGRAGYAETPSLSVGDRGEPTIRRVLLDAEGEGENRALLLVRTFLRLYGEGGEDLSFSYIRTGARGLSSEERLYMLAHEEADLYLIIGEDGGFSGIGGAYNGLYYHRGLNNGLLAQYVQELVCQEAGLARGPLKEDLEEGDLLLQVRIPAARLLLGIDTGEGAFPASSGEEVLLEDLAEGIHKALLAVAGAGDR